MSRIVIIGGGLAGLAAANALADRNVPCTLIEAGEFGRQKVCGEFISPEAVPLLRQWGIGPLMPLEGAEFISGKSTHCFKFPNPAASLSRAIAEALLAKRAASHGALLLTSTHVMDLKIGEKQHELMLSDGTSLHASSLLVAAGRLPLLAKPSTGPHSESFVGIKAHFCDVETDALLRMFLFQNAYLGVSAVEEGKMNVCCLACRTAGDSFSNPQAFVERLIASSPELKKRLKGAKMVFEQWLSCRIPSIGEKRVPLWPNTYFIGDARGTIHPASGDGLAMGLTSGVMAVDYLLRSAPREFDAAWAQRYRSRLRAARWLHRYSLLPSALHSVSFKLMDLVPSISRMLFEATREKSKP